MIAIDPKIRVHHLMREALRAFYWLDDSLQAVFAEHGWPKQSHAQSMVVLALGEGIDRPIDIARRLGISRQAVHQMLTIMSERGMVVITQDPNDRRNSIVDFSPSAKEIRKKANTIMLQLERRVSQRLGHATFEALVDALNADWGPPIKSSAELPPPSSGSVEKAKHRRFKSLI
ncbi:MAG: MarR family transcriptional regulator [Terriglobia bacterium]|nr:MarR family transcriptional regulator [Terriglobia bacterium]